LKILAKMESRLFINMLSAAVILSLLNVQGAESVKANQKIFVNDK